jgi:hypothetical protein
VQGEGEKFQMDSFLYGTKQQHLTEAIITTVWLQQQQKQPLSFTQQQPATTSKLHTHQQQERENDIKQ